MFSAEAPVFGQSPCFRRDTAQKAVFNRDARDPGSASLDSVHEVRALFLFFEDQGSGIEAVAKAGWPGSVLEDMAEVPVTTSAQNLSAEHAVAAVRLVGDIFRGDWLEETGPAGA